MLNSLAARLAAVHPYRAQLIVLLVAEQHAVRPLDDFHAVGVVLNRRRGRREAIVFRRERLVEDLHERQARARSIQGSSCPLPTACSRCLQAGRGRRRPRCRPGSECRPPPRGRRAGGPAGRASHVRRPARRGPGLEPGRAASPSRRRPASGHSRSLNVLHARVPDFAASSSLAVPDEHSLIRKASRTAKTKTFPAEENTPLRPDCG